MHISVTFRQSQIPSSLAVAVCNLLVVGLRKPADHPPGPRLPGFLALPRSSKNQQAELQYYLVNNLIQEAKLQYYPVNNTIQEAKLQYYLVNSSIQRS